MRHHLNQIAAAQHGLITFDEARTVGLSPGQRLDLAYPESRIAIELDGWEHHRTRSAFDDDRARANALVLDGWTLLRFTSQSADGTIVRSVTSALTRSGQSGAA